MKGLNLNTVSLVGRLGRDPEAKYFESGKLQVTFSLAVNNPFKKDEALWFDIEVWEKPAEVVSTYCKKGALLGLTGYIKIDHWDDKSTGASRLKHYVNATNIYLLGGKNDQQNQQAAPVYEGEIDF